MKERSDFSGFTEAAYLSILGSLRDGGYHFSSFHEKPAGRHVIWRHDVDLSLQRALWCARAEHDIGAIATYFINSRCDFYNLLEADNLDCVKAIADLGHEIGLHFDAGAMRQPVWTADALDKALKHECALLEMITGIKVRSVSWHNPDQSNLLEFDSDEIAGLVNAYGKTLKANYTYCSDSNGYWRFKPMPEVIAEGHERLYLLTHPGLWTPRALAPRERIERAVAGRAANVMDRYDAVLKASGRENIR